MENEQKTKETCELIRAGLEERIARYNKQKEERVALHSNDLAIWSKEVNEVKAKLDRMQTSSLGQKIKMVLFDMDGIKYRVEHDMLSDKYSGYLAHRECAAYALEEQNLIDCIKEQISHPVDSKELDGIKTSLESFLCKKNARAQEIAHPFVFSNKTYVAEECLFQFPDYATKLITENVLNVSAEEVAKEIETYHKYDGALRMLRDNAKKYPELAMAALNKIVRLYEIDAAKTRRDDGTFYIGSYTDFEMPRCLGIIDAFSSELGITREEMYTALGKSLAEIEAIETLRKESRAKLEGKVKC